MNLKYCFLLLFPIDSARVHLVFCSHFNSATSLKINRKNRIIYLQTIIELCVFCHCVYHNGGTYLLSRVHKNYLHLYFKLIM